MIVVALAELLRVVDRYRSEALTGWPIGVEIGVAVIAGLGVFLVRKGLRERRRKP